MKFSLSPITKGIIVSAAGGMILLHGSGFSLSSVEAQQKSAIQQELERLYRQQGRPAPDMRVNSLPRETIDGRVFRENTNSSGLPVATQPGAQSQGLKYDPSLLSTNRIPAPPQYKRRKSLLDRLMFWKKDKPVPRRATQPAPQATQTPQAAQSGRRNSNTRKESAVAPAAPSADLPYQRPVTQSPRPYPPAPQPETSRQPVTLELPMNDSAKEPRATLPEWNPEDEPKPLRQPVAQPQPVRKPIISAEPQPGQLPVIVPKAPPVATDTPAPNRVIVSPDGFQDENEKSASLPELDDADNLGLPLSQDPQPLSASEESPFAEPEPLKGPRPMPEDVGTDPAFAEQPGAGDQAPAAVVDQPQETENPMPAAKLPNLDELPDEPLPIMQEDEKPVAEQPPMGEENFPDPFTDVSEQEADSNKADLTIPDIQMNDAPAASVPAGDEAEAATGESATPQLPDIPAKESAEDDAQPPLSEDENPFSGLKLDDADSQAPPLEIEPGAAPTLPLDVQKADSGESIEGPSASPSLPDIDPAFDDDFKLPVKKDTSEEPMPEHPILEKIPDNPLPELPAADEGDISWEEDQARREAKLALIAAREGETGMKGFCIVELRDHRDLVDAVPAFRSTYNLRTYHFSSLEAKIEFDKAPRKYVPAYDGNDPILLSTQSEEREGSLDYALWFKGRLYLFTSQENLEVFQADPVLYSEN
jgi:YHS domain-containing protein